MLSAKPTMPTDILLVIALILAVSAAAVSSLGNIGFGTAMNCGQTDLALTVEQTPAVP